jgi:hypothetical protein
MVGQTEEPLAVTDPERMALLDEAIEASGGVEHWNSLKQFTLQLSIDGALFSRFDQAGQFKNMVAEGSTRSQSVRFAGFADSGKCGLYQPDCVSIETPEGAVLRSWRSPRLALPDRADQTPSADLYLIFVCGVSIWNYLTTPFLLARPDVRIEELPPRHEQGQTWRRLHAVFPQDLVTHSPEQTFYFDYEGLQRRTDYDLLGAKVAEYSWAYQAFDGIVVPTLRRSLLVDADRTASTRPSLIDVEIFDAAFK